MIGFSTDGPHASLTASHTLITNSGDESENVSGLNSNAHSVPACDGSSFVMERAYFVHLTASSKLWSSVIPKTILRKHSLVARYICRRAFLAPLRDSTVLVINSSRHGERTWSHTSSGTAPGVSTRRRVKSKSVCEAEGKETSISLYPSSQSILKYDHFWSPSCCPSDQQLSA